MKHLIAALLLALSGAVLAQDQTPYFGAQYGNVVYQEIGSNGYDLSSIVLRGGMRLSDHVAVEGRFAFGLGDDINLILGSPVKLELNHLYGVYVMGILPLTDTAEAYGIVGYTDGELTATGPGGTVVIGDDDISFGIGGQVEVANDVKVTFEYMQYFNEATYDVEAITVGVVKLF